VPVAPPLPLRVAPSVGPLPDVSGVSEHHTGTGRASATAGLHAVSRHIATTLWAMFGLPPNWAKNFPLFLNDQDLAQLTEAMLGQKETEKGCKETGRSHGCYSPHLGALKLPRSHKLQISFGVQDFVITTQHEFKQPHSCHFMPTITSQDVCLLISLIEVGVMVRVLV